MTDRPCAVVLAAGTPLLERAFRTVVEGGLEVAAVLVDRGFNERRWPGLYGRWEEVLGGHGVRLVADQRDVAAQGLALLSCLYTRRIEARLLDAAAVAVNVHPGPLPELGGLRVVEYAIATGRRSYGATAHLMTADYDAGPIVDACPVPIHDADTAGDLAARANDACLELLRRVLARLAGPWPPGLGGVDAGGPHVMAGSAVVEDLLRPRPTDDDAELLRKLRAACWDGETAVVLGRELTADGAGVAALRSLLR